LRHEAEQCNPQHTYLADAVEQQGVEVLYNAARLGTSTKLRRPDGKNPGGLLGAHEWAVQHPAVVNLEAG
jgi:hypothetical protein